MTPDNGPMANYRMECAQEALKDSQMLLEKGAFRASVNRSYYAMFYSASSLLAIERLAFKKHSAVIGAFRREFVKAGKFPETIGDWLHKGFKRRGKSDYEDFVVVGKAEAEELLKNAGLFVAKAREIVDKELK